MPRGNRCFDRRPSCIRHRFHVPLFPRNNTAGEQEVSSDRLIFSLLTVVVMENLIVSLDFLEFPLMYTCDGGNHSPRLVLKGLQAASVAVMVFNPFEKSCCSFTPWIIWNLPPLQEIPAGIPREGKVATPITALQGVTDYGTIGYTGPCPPRGQMIRYQFKVYGLDTMLALTPGSDKHQLISSMKGHVLQFGETVAICTR
jgi:Raf kinase inhibitor-like YbhB/YbcL family protein